MVSFPNAKINLGLRVIRKREDGYHDIETVFYPINGLRDALEIVRGTSDTPVDFNITGLTVQGEVHQNLCVKAYTLLKQDFPSLPNIQMHLHKTIPMGAGLGGGSADGAFTLRLLNQQFQLGLTQDQLTEYALQLGSDCPFFILNQPCFATGRGEIMKPLSLDLIDYQLVLVNPGIHVPTGWAFGQLIPTIPTISCEKIVSQDPSTWQDQLINDFETPVMGAFPKIRELKELLYQYGAVYASLTGTGSTVYGIFKKETIISLSFPEHYFVYKDLAD
ncbi:MAG: 4-(cytidine 5'-diphospho)-2-C-methyl-D-erythritol kinase [Chitinophagaceae bacterium]|nr:4-(cytidine 5'-diphospho)-2-C-methyl-D-erythritol kinase [Chitinophagaceae bacterium]